ncbi:MAG: beta-N-acetylhexosaminidase [Myxococcales bacterium]|nr:beta-N-acetylhexosaminidase [Myxococcales bacterium]MCB9749816.1 beta-N-acetylhexosaminidase [Myxococcales bacterium]
MTHAWQPGQLLFVGFHGHEVPRALAERVAQGRVGGVILFARNIDPEDPAQLWRLCQQLQERAPPAVPLLIAIDQEGGRVQRLRAPWTEWPAMARLGKVNDVDYTAAVAKAIARELADYGIGLDFAPVVDVDTNPANPVIGDRSFGREAERVARHARAFIEAMQGEGVACCAKHFPGHGDTISDSHLELPRLEHDLDRLGAVELPPFRAAAAAGVASVMTAHVMFPRLDRRRPATLSPDILQRLLREGLGYEGVVFSDDLEMRAVADHFSVRERVLGALEAGVDGLLICSEHDLQEEALRLLERAPDRLLERALERMTRLKEAYARRRSRLHVPAGPPYAAHQKLSNQAGEG